jgi:hypothetical protein
MTIGDTVFVRWYGKILEGMIVENNEVTPALASMVVVRIPVQGVRASALFTPDHVSSSAELAGIKEHIKVVPTELPTFVPTAEATPNDVLSEAWRKLQEFKLANWDTERNHIKLSALNDYYDMWKEYVAEKCGYREYPKHPYVPEFNGWNYGIKQPSVGETISNAIKEAKRIVSDEKMTELKSQIKKALAPAKPKPRKTVNYTQLSLWD